MNAAGTRQATFPAYAIVVLTIFPILATACGGGGDGGGAGPGATTYTISGSVSGAVSQDVAVDLSGAKAAGTTTAANGSYTFTGLANGAYTVTPSLAGYTMSPLSASVTVNGANVTGRNFVASAASGVWTTRAAMTTARSSLASADAGGIIYAIGGLNYDVNTTNGWLATNEAYDPVANSWTTKAPMPTARQGLSAAAVGDVIYAIGGDNVVTCGSCNGFKVLATVEAYDRLANTWSTKSSMAVGRERFSTAVVNGIVYAVGGLVTDNSVTPAWVKSTATVEAYNPATNSWTTKASMASVRSDVHVVALNGIIYAIAGRKDTYPPELLSVEAYDPVANTWTAKASLPAGNPVSSAVVVNGVIYVIRDYGEALTYSPTANTWTVKTSMYQSFYEFNRAASVVGGTIYIMGGRDSFGAVNTVDAFKP